MTKRAITVRKTTLAEANDRDRDLDFWQSRPVAERFLTVFQMSEEAYALAGWPLEQARGSSRRTTRLLLS